MSTTEFFYNRFSFLYPLVDIFLRPQKKALVAEINRLPEGDLLDIGVGNGAQITLYKKHKITGIDTSEAMLEIARKRNRAINLLRMNGEALSFANESFDYVVLSHVIAVIDNPDRLLEEVFRVLRPDGRVLILNHFTPDNWLRHLDRSFSPFSKALHFKSVFRADELKTLNKFLLVKEVHFTLSYFKLLIFLKK
ncbi:MAG TPA: class I SAM-dependent methyltransferase [Chryseosolibacter sp.]|nr:class I SAM-dependent methyltransferase [Chryseosolibacter sp.]